VAAAAFHNDNLISIFCSYIWPKSCWKGGQLYFSGVAIITFAMYNVKKKVRVRCWHIRTVILAAADERWVVKIARKQRLAIISSLLSMARHLQVPCSVLYK